MLAYAGKASTCSARRKKTKRREIEVFAPPGLAQREVKPSS